MTYTLAPTITLVPSDLDETQYYRVGEDGTRKARAAWIDPVAGTLQVSTGEMRHGAETFFWLPPVPLAQVTGLLSDTAYLLSVAWPGMRIIETPHDEFPADVQFDEQATIVLWAICALFDTVWQRWSGRDRPCRGWARCRWCRQPIRHLPRGSDGRHRAGWVLDDPSSSQLMTACRPSITGTHQSYQFPHPYAGGLDLRPGHHPHYTEHRDGTWSGTCCCGAWSAHDTPCDGRDVVNGYLEHLDQALVPPGAPFAVPRLWR